MGRTKKTAEQLNAERTSERFIQDQRECNRLIELTDHKEIREALERLARAYGQGARRWQDYATELEYAHLYEEMELGT
jgi:hypothetical protein